MAHKLHDQTVLITGASRGIGFEMSRAFARQGARVLMLARDPDALARACLTLQGEGLSVQSHAADVTDPAAVEAAVSMVMARHGRLDVLVNNAGHGRQQPFLKMAPAQMRSEIETNYFGVLCLLRAVLPHMVAAGRGVVLNVSSVCGLVATPSMANYSASKAALNLLTHSLRGELAGTGVQLGIFVPGHTATDLGKANRFDRVPIGNPSRVGEEAVKAALNPRPEYFARGGDRLLYRMGRLSPRLAEWAMAGTTRAFMRETGPDRANPSPSTRSSA